MRNAYRYIDRRQKLCNDIFSAGLVIDAHMNTIMNHVIILRLAIMRLAIVAISTIMKLVTIANMDDIMKILIVQRADYTAGGAERLAPRDFPS